MRKLLHSPYFVVAALALLALVYRLVLLRTVLWTVDSDQAVFGLMARHIVHGERPVFFYGQSYQGALEAYLTAGIFRLWGQDDLALRVAPTLFSVLLVAQLYTLARGLYGRGVALATGLWLALPAPVLILWGTAAGSGYVEVTAIGTALVMIAVRRWGLGRPRGYDLPSLGLLAGLGVWEQPSIAYYLVTLLVTWTALTWRRLLRVEKGQNARRVRAARVQTALRHAWPVPVCFMLGAAPWLGYTARRQGTSFSVLSGLPDPATLPGTLGRLLSEALPVLLGGSLPATLGPDYVDYANAHILPYAVALLALGAVLVRLVTSPGGLPAQTRALLIGRPLADAPLALLPLVTIGLYLSSRFEALSWTTHNPRYLLPLYTATPYLIACIAPNTSRALARRRARARRGLAAVLGVRPQWLRSRSIPRVHPRTSDRSLGPPAVPGQPASALAHDVSRPAARLRHAWREVGGRYHERYGELAALYRDGARLLTRPLAALGLAALVTTNVYGCAHFRGPVRVTPLAAALVSRGDTAVYCYYWLAYRLAFESEERLTPVVTAGQGITVAPRSNSNRYTPYLAQAPHARRWAYVLPYDVGVPVLLAALRHAHVPFQRWHWDNASVFDGPVQPNFPPRKA